MKFAIVGSGFSGAVVANNLASHGYDVDLFESRSHIAGNCYTERDCDTGILVHKYGPHIFHTDNEEVWRFVTNYAKFKPFINRVKTTTSGQVYSLPINLHTINQFFNKNFTPSEARNAIASICDKTIKEPKSFEEQALKTLGKSLYETFFKAYTIKQWGIDPKQLPASIFKRLPVRFNYDDNYFNHRFQGMPENGYTEIIEKLIDHPRIQLHIQSQFSRRMKSGYDHVFFTGPIDQWFEYQHGHLGYRTLDFKAEIHSGDYQGCAVMNYADESVPYVRICEHKHFSPWEHHENTLIYKEYSRDCEKNDIPYYPVRLVNEKIMLQKYVMQAYRETRLSFIGRLGTFRYLDMDATIAEALHASRVAISAIAKKTRIPVFFNPMEE